MFKSQVSLALSLLTTFVLSSNAVPVRFESHHASYVDQSRYDFESRRTDSLMNPVPSTKVRRNEPQNLQTLNQEVPNYDFEYQIHGGGNVFGHVEKRRKSTTNGKYYVILPDFRRQVVSYYADETGYHATITYEPLPRPQNSIDTEGLERRKPQVSLDLGNQLGNVQNQPRRVVSRTRTSNKKTTAKNRQEEVQHRKQTRETPAEQILYALAQFEEHQHRQRNRSTSRRSYRY